MIRAFQAFVLTLGGGAHGNWARAEFKVKLVQVFICQSQDYAKAPFVRLRSKCMMSDCSWSTGFSKDTIMYHKTWDDPKHLPLKPQLWPSDQTLSRAQNSFTHNKICFSVYIHTLRGNHPTVRWANCSFPWGLISRPHFWQSGQVTKAKSAHQWTWACGAGVQLSQETPTELYRHPDVTVSGYDCGAARLRHQTFVFLK